MRTDKETRDDCVILLHALRQVHRTIFAAGAPLGSQEYFNVREIIINALKKVGALYRDGEGLK